MIDDARLQLYLQDLEIDIREARAVDVGDVQGAAIAARETAFTDVLIQRLGGLCQIGEITQVHLEKKFGRSHSKLNGYGVSDDGESLEILVTVPSSAATPALARVSGDVLDSALGQALAAVHASQKPVFKEMEPAHPEYDMMQRMHELKDVVRAVRVIILVDGVAARMPNPVAGPDGTVVTVDVWDLERLFRLESSGLSYEPVEIDVVATLGHTIPCVVGPDIGGDHVCHLAILPGNFVADLYNKHGSRLLELNVRSFLQAKGKVNKGIRDTLLGDGDHFLAFNNGLSATVEELDVRVEAGGTGEISRMKGLQIVNGGQTVASIHRARFRDRKDLSNVSVQAKITLVRGEAAERLVPSISRFANTQNKVNETDFSANHVYHVEIQKLSEAVWAPGETSRWFYERARGQYDVARAREGSTVARQREFDLRTPRTKRFDKVHLAQAMNAWDELPHIVSCGGQKNFVKFMDFMKRDSADLVPDEVYYRKCVAKVMLYREAERIARKLNFSAYRANVVCYSISLLTYRTAARLDLLSIWERQSVSDSVSDTLESWMPRVHECLTDTASGRNVTEWCKKSECWAGVRGLALPLNTSLGEELAQGLPLPTVGANAGAHAVGGAKQLTQDDLQRQAMTTKFNTEELAQIMDWAAKSGQFDDKDLSIGSTVLSYSVGGWRKIPSERQTPAVCKIIDAWEQSHAAQDSMD
jgi:hypothetical protein